MKPKNLFTALPALSLAAMGGLAGCATEQGPPRPNVILILADDVGYGDLGCYNALVNAGTPEGRPTIFTPAVEQVAANGLLFTNAHSVASTSTPSRYSLFTGLYSWRREGTGIAAGNAKMVINPDQFTVADAFKSIGYTTGAIGKWHLGLGSETGAQDWNGHITPGPSDLGFEYSYIMAATGDRVPCVWIENEHIAHLDPADPVEVSYTTPFPGEPLGRTHPELLYKLHPSHGHDMAIVHGISRIGYMKGGRNALWEDEFIADTLTTKAVQFIEQHKDQPFFLYVGTNDIHVPRWPHPRFVGQSGMGPRGDAILSFNWTVEQIVNTLERNGLTENTILIITSDNGPVVDDGYKDQAVELLGHHRPWGDFRGGKYSNFEAGTSVPLIIQWPGKVPKGKTSAALVSQIDLLRSLADLVGAPVPEGAAPDSQNAWPAFCGKDAVGREYVVESGYSLSIQDGTWKYITPNNYGTYIRETNTELGNSPQDQLYNLTQDINEQRNCAADYPQEVARLKALLQAEKDKGY